MTTLLDQAGDAAEVARQAFAAGDNATGIAAIVFAAQLVRLARLLLDAEGASVDPGGRAGRAPRRSPRAR